MKIDASAPDIFGEVTGMVLRKPIEVVTGWIDDEDFCEAAGCGTWKLSRLLQALNERGLGARSLQLRRRADGAAAVFVHHIGQSATIVDVENEIAALAVMPGVASTILDVSSLNSRLARRRGTPGGLFGEVCS
jgi:hypothetical protein